MADKSTQKPKASTKGTRPSTPNRNSKSNNRKPVQGTKSPSKTLKREPIKRRDPSANDIGWYSSDINLLRTSANHPYSENLGDAFQLTNETGNFLTEDSVSTIPGVCLLKIAPSIGVTKDAKSAANVAMRAIETYVRKMNSGAKNYEATDLMIYLLAMDQLYSFYGWMTRLYATARSYDMYNKYMPAGLLAAEGINSQDIRQHLNDLYGYLLLTANQLNRFAVPRGLKYFERHYWLYSNVYKDAPSAKAQLYMFSPEFFWKFEPYVDQTGGKLTATRISASSAAGITYADIVEFYDGMLNAVLGEDDMGIMAGDIFKAYGRGNLYFITPCDVNITLFPTYQPEVLTQIQNLTAVGTIGGQLSKWDVTQSHAGFEDSILIHEPRVLVPAKYPDVTGINKVFSVPVGVDETSPELTMVASRLTAFTAGGGNDRTVGEATSGWSTKLTTCGSDVCTTMAIYRYSPSGRLSSTEKFSSAVCVGTVDTPGVDPIFDPLALDFIGALSNFDYHPTIITYYRDLSDNDRRLDEATVLMNIYGHIDTYTIITPYEEDRMNKTAIWSLFAVPAMALWK